MSPEPARSDPAATGDPPAQPLTEPRDGVPRPVVDQTEFDDVVRRFAAGHGPVAIDAERASGYRYGQRAYLVQLRRSGAGTTLIDPLALPDLRDLDAALADAEWVLHAATQDLPCLAELGLRPRRLFDTELAGRLAGLPRVGLAAIVEAMLGLSLQKGHGAADWSTRPLPEPWLRYAALDVEVLVELRDALAAELTRQGKLAWAEEEFAALVDAPPPPVRPEPWRRTSGIHRLRTRRQLARLRALWQVRDDIARDRDLAPGRVVRDAALVSAAGSAAATPADLLDLPSWRGRATRRYADPAAAALAQAAALDEAALPLLVARGDGLPPAARWQTRDPAAAARLVRVRAVLAELADRHGLPLENLLPPEAGRRLAWSPPSDPPVPVERVAAALRAHGARAWQVEVTAAPLAAALDATDASADATDATDATDAPGPASDA